MWREGEKKEGKEGASKGGPIVMSNAFLSTNRFPTGTVHTWLGDILLCHYYYNSPADP